MELYAIFKLSRDYGFKDQILRAAISIMNNIAEGYERRTNNEFKHFLYIAKGSCAEVRSMLRLSVELKYLDEKQFRNLYLKCEEVSKMISGFIKTL